MRGNSKTRFWWCDLHFCWHNDIQGIEEKFKRIMETVSKSIYSQMDSDNDGQLSKCGNIS